MVLGTLLPIAAAERKKRGVQTEMQSSGGSLRRRNINDAGVTRRMIKPAGASQ